MPALKPNQPSGINPESNIRDFVLWESELLEIPILQRRLGRAALETVRINARYNNDHLAHVWQLVENKDLTPSLLEKFKAEFITDMGERSPGLGHYHIFSMAVVDSDIVSSTGISMKSSLADSVVATRNDAMNDPRREYGLLRELVQQDHIEQVVRWQSDTNGDSMFGFASLCPSGSELSAMDAKVNGFKPEKMMASLWIYEKTYSGLDMHALSLDYCTPARFQRLMDVCGIDHTVKPVSLDELGNPISFSDIGIDEIRLMWEQILALDSIDTTSVRENANLLVEGRPEAFRTYSQFVVDVACSLSMKHVNKNLANLLKVARSSSGTDEAPILGLRRFRRFDEEQARSLMEFVRTRMIPHYLYDFAGMDDENSVACVLGSSGGAASRVDSYDGACPTSDFSSRTSELSAMASSGIVSRQLIISKLMSEKRRGNCLTCGHEQTTVYGCGLCSKCNKMWCEKYSKTGIGLSIAEIKKRVTPKTKSSKVGARQHSN